MRLQILAALALIAQPVAAASSPETILAKALSKAPRNGVQVYQCTGTDGRYSDGTDHALHLSDIAGRMSVDHPEEPDIKAYGCRETTGPGTRYKAGSALALPFDGAGAIWIVASVTKRESPNAAETYQAIVRIPKR